METKHIVWIIVGAFVLLLLAGFVSTQNSAIGYEENIEQSISGIQVQQQRQKNIITQLVQVVEQATEFESSTLKEVVEMRSAASSGNVEQAQIHIQAVAEAYPVLQSNQTFLTLMNEMSISENLVASYRTTYNSDVRNYNRYVRRFPARLFLSIAGYDVQSYPYLEFTNTELPTDLFNNGQ
jgi:LemA protein